MAIKLLDRRKAGDPGTPEVDKAAKAAKATKAEKKALREDKVTSTEKPGFFSMSVSFKKKKVKHEDLMLFARQLASFIRSGITILTALDILRESSDNPALQRVIIDLSRSLRLGVSFAEAVAMHPKVFPTYFRSILESAELTGRLDEVLDQLSRYLERDLEAARRIRSALAYPMVVLVMSFGTVAVLAIWVLPKFKKFFASLNAKLPLSTRMMLASTNFLQQYWWAVFGGLAAFIGLYMTIVRTAGGHRLKDVALINLPIVGKLKRLSIIERFCRLLGSMVGAGVSLPQALGVVGDACNNVIYKAALTKALASTLEGEGLSEPIAQTGLFPNAVIQMLRVGESTGRLDIQLDSAAKYYEQELDFRVKRFTTLFEPGVMIFMGVVVGFVAVALVQAMYGVYHQTGIK